MKRNRIPVLAALLWATGSIVASGGAVAQVYDPLEPVNRVIFSINDSLDRNIVKPVAQKYVDFVPRLVRAGVSNVFGNVSDAFSAINNLLQGKKEPFGSDLGRVLVNSTFGLGGIFDIASEANVEKYNEDFGQTLGWWGIGPGPYLVLPILGPSNARDATGLVAQAWIDPVNQVTPAVNQYELIGARALDTRASLLGTDDLVSGAALDKYTFIRSAYTQRRRSLVYDGKPPKDDDN
jgi:phospholipid-binding lipoprotein MlaA